MVTMRELGPVQMVADRLAALYPDERSLRRVLAMAQVDVVRVPFDGIAANASWFAALEAQRQGQGLRLVEIMVEEYPLDPWVCVLHEKMRGGRG